MTHPYDRPTYPDYTMPGLTRRGVRALVAITVVFVVTVGAALAWLAFSPAAAGAQDHDPCVFDDVDRRTPLGIAAARLCEYGVVEGLGDGIAAPGDPVTRGQMILFMCRLDAHYGGSCGTDVGPPPVIVEP